MRAEDGTGGRREVRWDLTDERSMALLRARLLGGMLLVGGVLWALSLLNTPSMRGGPLAVLALTGTLALGLAISVRAGRIGPREFSLWLLAGQSFATAYQSVMAGAMPQVPLETALICYLIMAAAFCTTRLDVGLLSAAASVDVAIVAAARLGLSGDLGHALGTEIPVFLTVTLAVRVLREVAHDSLLAAKKGELTDPLTGLANRRALERHGRASWAETAAGAHPLAFLILDIDHFKQVNDTLGHAAGDELIRRVADLLSSNLRQGDFAVRLGGEEFLLVTRATIEEAAMIAERLRRRFEEELHPVTVSIGVCEAHPDPADDAPVELWRAVDIADQALYRAKRGGRNQVAISPEAQPQPA